MSIFQCTIKNEISLTGIGIHTGKRAHIRFKPAKVNEGIIFSRVDLPNSPKVPANIDYVTSVQRGTTLQKGSAVVQTVEHLLATAYGLGIDNMLVEIDTAELPVGDGSARDYSKIFNESGIVEQEKERRYFSPSKVINYKHDKTEIMVAPSDRFSISATIHYEESTVLHSQFINFEITKDIFINEIAPARTYCFENEINNIRELGLGKGGTFENTIVIGEKGITNTKLRFEDEFVRHKILDLLGDLYLLGLPLRADVIAVRSGHAANIEITKKLKENFIEIESSKTEIVMDIDDILKVLPHRYPFLLVDRIEMNSSRKIATGYKNVTVNEPFFKGHFPGRPIFPPALIVEFMAQSSAVLLLSKPELQNKLAFFIIIENTEFFNEVRPWEMLTSKVELIRERSSGGKVRGVSYVGDKKVAEAEFMFTIVEKK